MSKNLSVIEGNDAPKSGGFMSTLQGLKEKIDPSSIKSREGWTDRSGRTHYVDYVEWHTVAEILDDKAPTWSHSIKEIREIGDICVVVVAITIDGVTREGLGTGEVGNEKGLKKAEHDALKRAAVKFGVARQLYHKDALDDERGGGGGERSSGGSGRSRFPEMAEFPRNPLAQNMADLLSPKQLGMIRAKAKENGVDADEVCQFKCNCKVEELSKRAASAFIDYLKAGAEGYEGERTGNVTEGRFGHDSAEEREEYGRNVAAGSPAAGKAATPAQSNAIAKSLERLQSLKPTTPKAIEKGLKAIGCDVLENITSGQASKFIDWINAEIKKAQAEIDFRNSEDESPF